MSITLEEAMALVTEEPKQIQPTKFKATAYIERSLRGAIDGIDTNDEVLLEDFVWENCQKGITCEVIYTETGKRKVYYAEKFNTETMGIDELLGDVQI
jgi:hypothetical protein